MRRKRLVGVGVGLAAAALAVGSYFVVRSRERPEPRVRALPHLPATGVAVARANGTVFLALDGRRIAVVPGFRLEDSGPEVVLFDVEHRGLWFLEVAHHRLVQPTGHVTITIGDGTRDLHFGGGDGLPEHCYRIRWVGAKLFGQCGTGAIVMRTNGRTTLVARSYAGADLGPFSLSPDGTTLVGRIYDAAGNQPCDRPATVVVDVRTASSRQLPAIPLGTLPSSALVLFERPCGRRDGRVLVLRHGALTEVPGSTGVGAATWGAVPQGLG